MSLTWHSSEVVSGLDQTEVGTRVGKQQTFGLCEIGSMFVCHDLLAQIVCVCSVKANKKSVSECLPLFANMNTHI